MDNPTSKSITRENGPGVRTNPKEFVSPISEITKTCASWRFKLSMIG